MSSTRLFVVYCLIVVLVSSCSKTDTAHETSLKRYPFKNVHIRYELSGASKGDEELYIADYGKYEKVISDYVGFLGGRSFPNVKTVLTRYADIYITFPDSLTGHQYRMPSLDSLYKLKEDFPPYTAILDSVLEQGKFQLEGTEVVAGALTQRWRQVMGNVTLFIYKGLVLKRIIEDETGAALVQTAVVFDTLWNADTSLFAVPTAITFTQPPQRQ